MDSNNHSHIYGVGWNVLDISGNKMRKHEWKYPAIMNHENIQEVKRWFDRLTLQEKNTMSIWFYTEDDSAVNDLSGNVQLVSFFTNIKALQKFFETEDVEI